MVVAARVSATHAEVEGQKTGEYFLFQAKAYFLTLDSNLPVSVNGGGVQVTMRSDTKRPSATAKFESGELYASQMAV